MQNSFEGKISVAVKEDDGNHGKCGSTKVLSRTTIANLGKTRTGSSLKIEHSKDKELINSGLHRLLSSFNTTKTGRRASKITLHKRSEHKSPSPPIASSKCILESQEDSHIVLTKQVSIDKYTMTDFQVNERKLDNMESTLLTDKSPTKCFEGRDLQWTDPRLLKKYSLVKKPYKKSLTIPYINKSEYGSEDNNITDEDVETEVVFSDKKHFFVKLLYYFCTTSVSFIGSMCGITLITVVLWKLLDENILDFQFIEAPKHDLFFKRNLTNLIGSIIYLVNVIFGKLLRLLTISTGEVFAKEEEPGWYKVL